MMGGVPASKRWGMSAQVASWRVTSEIISPPPSNGSVSCRASIFPHRIPIPVGPSILWAEKATKSAPSSTTFDGGVGDQLGGVDHHTSPVSMRQVGDLPDRWHRAQDVRHAGDGHDLHVGPQLLAVGVEVESEVVGHRDVIEHRTGSLGDHLPRNEVGVVFHLG